MSQDWWRGASVYQIYPRSFLDSNGDGVGDLPGIIERLPYIQSLGIDMIWVSPFFRSPMADYGYDVSDHRDVDPLFGQLKDFDLLLQRAHSLGLKVMIDQVLSHSSEQHPWFIESRRSRDNRYADWYVWADPLADGSPPNNWLSVFGASAWQWEACRRQYYLHNFLASQPDLNFFHPEVQDALLASVRFWCERGVDGFRFDACNFFFHDPLLRSNPPRSTTESAAGSVPPSNPYGMQQHLYDKSRPENLSFLLRLRSLMDEYGVTSIGEVGDDDSSVLAQYTSHGEKLHMAYSFGFLNAPPSASHIRGEVEKLDAALRAAHGWGCWAFSNHDVTRVVNRSPCGFTSADEQAHFAKLMLAVLGSLRGSFCIYQGEELGLEEADIPFEQLQDPYGKSFWPEYKGRDGCRTPMPWTAQAPWAGFSQHQPWLPIPKNHLTKAVELQEADAGSVLHFYRRFLHWRRVHPALARGEIRFHDAPDDALILTRSDPQERLLAAFNLSPRAIDCALPVAVVALTGHGLQGAQLIEEAEQQRLRLDPWSGFFAELRTGFL